MSYPVHHVFAGDVLPVFFSTYGKTNGESITLTGLAVTDIEIYKDGSTTQRASDAGYTLLDTDGIDFDTITGIHGFSIDTGDNTDAGFYTVGSWFHVVVSAVTVDSQTVNFIACAFRLLPAESVAGTPKVDPSTWDGTDISTGVPLAPTVAGRTLDVSAGGEAGIDWANIGSPTTAQNLSATNIDVDQVVASVSGAVGSVTGAVGSVAAGGIAAASFAAGAIDAAAIAANAIGASEVADGAIDAATFAAGAINAAAIATDAIDADALAADAVNEIWAKAIAELAQAAPSATPAVLDAIAMLYMIARNQVTVTATSKTFSNDAGTVVFKKALSDDGVTYTEAETAAGP